MGSTNRYAFIASTPIQFNTSILQSQLNYTNRQLNHQLSIPTTKRSVITSNMKSTRITLPGIGFIKVLNKAPTSRSRSNDALPSISPPNVTALELAQNLRKTIQLLYVEHVSQAGVDYQAMRQSQAYQQFKQQTQLLRTIDVSTILIDDIHKIAFFVNLYNAGMLDAVISSGRPAAFPLLRLGYGMNTGYDIGGDIFSLHDIENGILRGNRKISIASKPFRENDSRKRFCVDSIDARIHFVLNCAAGSCPPILFLTPDNVESTLEIAAKGFLNNERNLIVKDKTVYLSKIFDWYRVDFSRDGGERGLLQYIVENGDERNEQVQKVSDLIKQDISNVKVKWQNYDWTLNEK